MVEGNVGFDCWHGSARPHCWSWLKKKIKQILKKVVLVGAIEKQTLKFIPHIRYRKAYMLCSGDPGIWYPFSWKKLESKFFSKNNILCPKSGHIFHKPNTLEGTVLV